MSIPTLQRRAYDVASRQLESREQRETLSRVRRRMDLDVDEIVKTIQREVQLENYDLASEYLTELHEPLPPDVALLSGKITNAENKEYLLFLEKVYEYTQNYLDLLEILIVFLLSDKNDYVNGVINDIVQKFSDDWETLYYLIKNSNYINTLSFIIIEERADALKPLLLIPEFLYKFLTDARLRIKQEYIQLLNYIFDTMFDEYETKKISRNLLRVLMKKTLNIPLSSRPKHTRTEPDFYDYTKFDIELFKKVCMYSAVQSDHLIDLVRLDFHYLIQIIFTANERPREVYIEIIEKEYKKYKKIIEVYT